MATSDPVSRIILAAVLCATRLALAQSAPAAPAPDLGVPLPAAQLAQLRGGFDLVKNDVQLTSTVANNAAVNALSGNNVVTDSAFSNASGLPMVIQNSGSNVSIQNATVLNVQLQ